MPSEPVGSTILKPIPASIRRELQEKFDLAKRLIGEPVRRGEAFSRAFTMLAECVLRDPGNTIYVAGYLQQLRREREHRRQGWLSWLWNKPGRLPMPENSLPTGAMVWEDLLGAAEGNEPGKRLLGVAQVCLDSGCEQSALRILAEGVHLSPEAAEVRWELALALFSQGEFDAAVEQLQAFQTLRPGDDHCHKLLAALKRPTALQEVGTPNLADLPGELEKIQQWIATGELGAAEGRLAQLKLALGSNLQVEQWQEEWLLAKYRQELQRGTVAVDVLKGIAAGKDFRELISRLELELNRQEMGVFHSRSKRHPSESRWKLELATRLKRAGNFSEAIAILAELATIGDDQSMSQDAIRARLNALVITGECWQHLRQFDRAWAFMEPAGALALTLDVSADEVALALYRAGVLATSLGAKEKAIEYLSAIVVRPGGYRDAAAWLDKARKI